MSCSQSCWQAQRFGGTDVDGAEVGACGDKLIFEDGAFQRSRNLQLLVSSIEEKR